jgi:phage shock protein A
MSTKELAEAQKQGNTLEEEVVEMENALSQRRQELTSVLERIKLLEERVEWLSKDVDIA